MVEEVYMDVITSEACWKLNVSGGFCDETLSAVN